LGVVGNKGLVVFFFVVGEHANSHNKAIFLLGGINALLHNLGW